MLDADTLVEDHGLDRGVAEQFENSRDSIANLQLITEGENTGKRDESFGDWLDTRNDEYYERHLIPRGERLHELENFLDFLDARERLIREHIRETFSEFA